ncbi:MAG: hypothetical protein JNL98_25735 [Bryobacterales bacterium]|nr:hypothetical protein [Bryobacterales bacterium]
MAGYQLGTADPQFPRGHGSGQWRSEPQTNDMVALKAAIISHLPHALILIGPDAVAHMRHYFANTGQRYTINMEGLLREASSAQALYRTELAEAKAFAERLPPGTHPITSSHGSGGYVMIAESRNWSYAVGGYTVFGKGTVHIGEAVNRQRTNRLDFEFRFFDEYNWHEGNMVTLYGIEITDDLMGRFHRQGLAREFEMTGSVRRVETWTCGVATLRAVHAGG